MIRTRLRGAAILGLLTVATQALVKGECPSGPERPSGQDPAHVHPVTVPDMIQMTQPGENRFQGGMFDKHDIAKFSPDGKQFVFLLKRGNLKRDVNDYWIEWFRTAAAMNGAQGSLIAKFSSSSNRPAIRQIEWFNSHTITFLAETPGTVSQLYMLETATKRLHQVTHSELSLSSYKCVPQQGRCAYLTETRSQPAYAMEDRASGVVVRTQPLFDLLTSRNVFAQEFLNKLFVQRVGSSNAEPIHLNGRVIVGSPLYMSPDGKYLIVRTMFTGIPPALWKSYRDTALKGQLIAGHEKGESQLIYQFEIVTLATRHSQPLLNSPIPTGDYPDVKWSPDSKSVVLSGILLPLDETNHVGESVRRSSRFVAEVSVEDGRIIPITVDAIRLKSWIAKTGKLIGSTGSWSGAGSLSEGHAVAFEKTGDIWKEVTPDAQDMEAKRPLDVWLMEGMNSPPKILAENLNTRAKRLLLDLNPQFSQLQFGEVRDLGLLTTQDVSVKAGIYLPVGYNPATRYPLVIQTHEWSSERFWIDGPFSSAFAAQALAGKGFIVAQIALNRKSQSTPNEVESEAKGYEAVISYLDEHGMVDVNKIGIIGFSRTALGVKYALVHSKYHFAAATIADGSDVGYFRYIAYLNSAPWQTADAEGVSGGIPKEDGIQSWFHHSLDFDLSQISTPIRLEAYQPESLLFAWEIFGLRTRLGKPVDLVFVPGGEHVLVKPEDRLVSQQGTVDWFSFWLRGEEDEESTKTIQYRRWKGLLDGKEGGTEQLPITKERGKWDGRFLK